MVEAQCHRLANGADVCAKGTRGASTNCAAERAGIIVVSLDYAAILDGASISGDPE